MTKRKCAVISKRVSFVNVALEVFRDIVTEIRARMSDDEFHECALEMLRIIKSAYDKEDIRPYVPQQAGLCRGRE